MSDMSAVIIPKSDQLNADDLIAGPMTIKITQVTIRGGQEQPISISFEGDNGKPYKACKSMCRVMVSAWGADSKKYIGRSMTLYRDPTVRWGGMEVGGIRISHMSDIAKPITLALTMTKANRKPFTVQPLRPTSAAVPQSGSPSDSRPAEDFASEGSFIDADQQANIRTLCKEAGVELAEILKRGEISALSDMSTGDYDAVVTWLQRRATKARQASQPSAPAI